MQHTQSNHELYSKIQKCSQSLILLLIKIQMFKNTALQHKKMMQHDSSRICWQTALKQFGHLHNIS